ncbi:MAG TPA: DUF2934 domain-containing protein [Terriglobales bacterium]
MKAQNGPTKVARRSSSGFMPKRVNNTAKISGSEIKLPEPSGTETDQRIRERAYELYLQRGRQPGRADEDWRLAEEEIRGITGGG